MPSLPVDVTLGLRPGLILESSHVHFAGLIRPRVVGATLPVHGRVPSGTLDNHAPTHLHASCKDKRAHNPPRSPRFSLCARAGRLYLIVPVTGAFQHILQKKEVSMWSPFLPLNPFPSSDYRCIKRSTHFGLSHQLCFARNDRRIY